MTCRVQARPSDPAWCEAQRQVIIAHAAVEAACIMFRADVYTARASTAATALRKAADHYILTLQEREMAASVGGEMHVPRDDQ